MFGSDKTGNGPGGPGNPHGPGGGSPGLGDGDACDDSPLSRFLCDPTSLWEALARRVEGVWDTLVASWPLAVLAAALLLAGTGVLAASALRTARIREAARACWVEVVPPAEVPEGGAGALWQTLATMVAHTRRFGFGSRHLVAEFVNESGRTRVGLWVPPSLKASAVADAVRRCWPGARTTITRPPHPGGDGWSVPSGAGCGRLVACEVMPGAGAWTPLLDPGSRASSSAPPKRTDVDPLSGVLGALADTGEDEWACVQLVVSPRQLRASNTTTSSSGVGGPWWARALIGLARLPGHVLIWVFDVMTSHPSNATGSGRSRPQPVSAVPDDPVTAARNRATVTKRAYGRHLCATLRVAVTASGTRGQRRAAVYAVADGYGLAASETMLRTRHLARPYRSVTGRRPGRMRDRFMVTLPEAAALWHLPADPARYGIAAVVAHTRDAEPGITRMTRPTRQRRQPGDAVRLNDDYRNGGHRLLEGDDHDTAA